MARSSDPAKAAAWRERLARFETSELKTAEFCEAEGVSTASFYAWRRKLGLAPLRGRPAFQQVTINAASALTAELPGGVRLEASGGDQQSLRTIVSELVRAAAERPPC